MDFPTRRQQLIGQMRAALNQLCDPRYSEENGEIDFEIADTSFCFTDEDLDEIQN